MSNIDITKRYQTRDGREVVIFEVSDKVYCKIKCTDGWASLTRSLSGMIYDCGKYTSGDLIPVKTWRKWKEGEAPKFFMVKNKESGFRSIERASRVISNYSTYYLHLFSHYDRLHEDGTTTPCGVCES